VVWDEAARKEFALFFSKFMKPPIRQVRMEKMVIAHRKSVT
jgi:hypothetical protein